MVKRLYKFFYVKYKRYRCCNGFTLIELLISMFLIALLAVGLIKGTTVALNTVSLNKEKTRAIAVANEKVELLKAMDYEEIGLTSEDPGWEMSYPELSEDGYSIYYYSSWVNDEENSYKQVMVSVLNADINVPVEVVTRIYPSLGSAAELEPGYPSPTDLIIDHDIGYFGDREIKLTWLAPETERVIDLYNIYRDGELIGTSTTLMYLDYPGDNSEYNYYVTTIYEDTTESDPSNTATATAKLFYASPENLVITNYTGSGSNREVQIAWSAPISEYTIVEYKIYRDGVLIGSTQNESYQDLIGTENYTYYVTTYYEGGNESDPSISVTTEPELTYPPPQNLSYTITGTGNQRWVHLLWDPPDSSSTIVEYKVYRAGGYRTSTTITNFSERIRRSNYTYYITAVYEGGIESDPSDSVTTE